MVQDLPAVDDELEGLSVEAALLGLREQLATSFLGSPESDLQLEPKLVEITLAISLEKDPDGSVRWSVAADPTEGANSGSSLRIQAAAIYRLAEGGFTRDWAVSATNHSDRSAREVAVAAQEAARRAFAAAGPVRLALECGGYLRLVQGGSQVRGDDSRLTFESTSDIGEPVCHWLDVSFDTTVLFFTSSGTVFGVNAQQVREVVGSDRNVHVADLLSLPSGESVVQVLAIESFEQMPYLVLATRSGRVKKTRLTAYNRLLSGGIKAISLAEGDAVIGARLITAPDDLLLVSRRGMALRFNADDQALRLMGRISHGVHGMRLRADDELLAMFVLPAGLAEDDTFLFTVTDGGFAKRTPVADFRRQGRAGLGLKAAQLTEARGGLVGALVVDDSDEVLSIRAAGGVTRSPVAEVPATGRDTMEVAFVDVDGDDAVVAIAAIENT